MKFNVPDTKYSTEGMTRKYKVMAEMQLKIAVISYKNILITRLTTYVGCCS